MIIPPYLKSGDEVVIISTARKISKQEVQPAIDILSSWGLKVSTGKHLFESDNQYAGTDKQRTDDLQSALDSPTIKAIICARGGYGTVRIIDNINFENLKTYPKWICGFSDVTVLHSALNNARTASIHSTMPVLFHKREQTDAINTLRDALFGESLEYRFPSHSFNRGGDFHGEIVGGNLSIINNLIGTASDLASDDKILFLEDLDEYLYHIDRMMQQLDRSGILKGLKGLVVGHMSDMNDNTTPFGKSAYETIQETVAKYDYPVVYDFPCGHLDHNYAIKLGMKISIRQSADKVTSHQ